MSDADHCSDGIARNDVVVAITGMGLVTPLGRDLDSVWKRVARGDSGVSRWNGEWKGRLSGWPVALADGFSEEPNRSVRFAVDASLAALSDAAVNPKRWQPDRVGVCLGNSKGNVLALERALEQGVEASTLEDFYHGAANAAVMQATGAQGPCLSLVSACATGAHNIAQGARWILDDEADIVVAGASESSLTPLMLHGFRRMGVLSDSFCRPYDHGRNGFVMGEGAGVVVLERIASARARGARIYAALTGWGFSADACKPVSFDPSGDSIVRAMEICARRSGRTASTVDYINCHGTGTRENDTIETKALKRWLDCAEKIPALSSTKPLTGHLLGAAGSVELILAILAMRHDFAPATLHLNDPDPACDLDFTAKTGRSRQIDHAMSLSYGFGGHVAAMAVSKIQEIHGGVL